MPTVLSLALVHGLLEEGLVGQSLFNPHFPGLDLLSYGHIDWLGTGATSGYHVTARQP